MSNNKRKHDNEESRVQDDGHRKANKRRKSEHKPTANVNGVLGPTKDSQAQGDSHRKEKKRRKSEHKSTADVNGAPDGTEGDVHRKEENRRQSEHKAAADVNGVPGDSDIAKIQATSNDGPISEPSKATSNEQGAISPKRKKSRRKDGERRDKTRDTRNKERMAARAQRKREKIKHRDKVSRKDLVATTEHKKHSKQQKVEENEQKPFKRKEWRLSKAIGGRMLSIDPLFSPEEESDPLYSYSSSTDLCL